MLHNKKISTIPHLYTPVHERTIVKSIEIVQTDSDKVIGNCKKSAEENDTQVVDNFFKLHPAIKRLRQKLNRVYLLEETQSLPLTGEAFLPFVLLEKFDEGAYGGVFLAEFNMRALMEAIKDKSIVHPIQYLSLSTKEPNIRLNFPFTNSKNVVVKKEKIDVMKHRCEMTREGKLESETHLLSNCIHPNIVSYIGSIMKDEDHYLIMEHVEGCSLRSLITQKIGSGSLIRYWTESSVLFVFVQLCLAIEYLHRHNIMHRDLKSANALITKDSFVKLIDFGFAIQQTKLSAHAFEVVGTPNYMSPQLVQRFPYTEKSDCWALGVMLYELLNLTKPFPGENVSTLAKSIVCDPYFAFDRAISLDTKELLHLLLDKDESSRPSMRQVLKNFPSVKNAVNQYLDKVRSVSINSPSNQVALTMLEEQVQLINREDFLPSALQQGKHAKEMIFAKQRYTLFYKESEARIDIDNDFQKNYQKIALRLADLQKVSRQNSLC